MTESGIYSITNLTNGHRYVGSAVDIAKRRSRHLTHLRRGDHHCRHLQSAWNKYGEGAFEFETLEEWEPGLLVSQEQWWINMLRPEYNIAKSARSTLGVKYTEGARANVSAGKIGKRPSAEALVNMSAAQVGRKHPPETRAKIAASMAGKCRQPFSDEWRANMSASHKRYYANKRKEAQG